MQWQPMPNEDRLRALIEELAEALCEYYYGYDKSELIDRAWGETDG